VRIIVFAFLLDGGVSEAAYRGAQTFDRFVANPEGFRQGMFQDLALGLEGLSGPEVESQRFRSRREPSGDFARHPKRATGFALMIPIRREDLGLLLE
jgi:hypothetical protein